jgi:hypothetical protein
MIKELLIYIIDCNNQLILTIKMNRYIYFQLFYFFLRTAMDHYLLQHLPNHHLNRIRRCSKTNLLAIKYQKLVVVYHRVHEFLVIHLGKNMVLKMACVVVFQPTHYLGFFYFFLIY